MADDGAGTPSRAGEAAAGPGVRGPRSAFALLAHRNYRLLWSGMFVSHIGAWMQFTALGYLVDQLTKAPIYLGLLGLSQAIPRLLFAFLGGVAADRLDRRRVLLITNGLQMLTAALLGVLAYTDRIQVWHILAIGAFNSFTNSFDMPARQSMVPLLVGERQLMPALSLNSLAFQGSGIFGPSLGGLLIAAVGIAGCFFANTLTHSAAVIALLRMDVPPHAPGERLSVREDIREGIGLLIQQRHLLALLGIVAVISFFGRPYIRLMPALAREVLHVGPQGLGLLQAAPAVGTAVAVLLIGAISESAHKGRLLITAVTATGVTVLLFGLSPWFGLSLVLLALVGTCQSVAHATANTLLQTSVQPHQRGRVMGLYGTVTFGMFALGTLPLGALAGVIGVGYALSIGGALVIALVTLLSFVSPAIKRL